MKFHFPLNNYKDKKETFTFRLAGVIDVTLKKLSRRPCVVPFLAFSNFLDPLRILSSL